MTRKIYDPLTRNIAKSGEVLNWNGFSPFQLHLGLIRYHSQSASCHIAIRCASAKKTTLLHRKFKKHLQYSYEG